MGATPPHGRSPKAPQVREPSRYSWRTMAMGLGLLLSLAGGWWYGLRPYQLMKQAEAQLLDNPQAAAVLLEDAASLSPTAFRRGRLLWTRSLLRSGRWEEAIGCFSQIDRPGNANHDQLMLLADEALAAQIDMLARMSLDAVPPSSAEWPLAAEKLSSLYLQSGRDAAALQLARQLAIVQPDNPRPWWVMSQIHEQQMALTESAEALRQYLPRETDPALQTLGLRSLVRTLIQLGKREEARHWQSRIPPVGHPVDRLQEAQLRRMEGDITGAQLVVDALLSTEGCPLAAWELHGTLAMDRGDYSAAAPSFQYVLREQPWNRPVHYKQFQTLTKLGRAAEADRHLQISRRLLAMTNRILHLRSQPSLSSVERQELIDALYATGLNAMAERMRQAAPHP